MRFAKITACVMLSHSALVFVLFFLAFGCAMTAFGGGTLVPAGRLLATVLAVLHLPVFLFRAQYVSASHAYWTETPMLVLTAWPSPLQFIWSVLLGCMVAWLWTSLIKPHDT